MRELKRRNAEFVMLSIGDTWGGIWIASPEEVTQGGIPATEETIESAVERAIQMSKGLGEAILLIIGIDPGPRPGIAWLADGALVGACQLESIEEVINKIFIISNTITHNRICVKIGNGAPLIRDRLINQLIKNEIEIIEVSEYRTSKGSRINTHIHAATRIALQNGKRVTKIREIEATEGDLKEIQRQSRISSGGAVTISSNLANLVAIGQITIEEAIKKS
jgi:translation initiation factor 1 (eIF-1/SUI1)